ncbi:putative disease resistance RPP13-like protein 1 [Morella rubra]|uniref:Putative disease resistance RPP13-like protein 1 n=1 Tax=Morella rubra TaxID=262757 RepID=A0A6A1W7P7_9ROSI|nr:putative disease resistance RPP13-like protein 1 [Morella rubra]
MKHLRYLDVSSTSIERLPDSICELCSLQTLELSWCKRLSSLPGDIRKLVKLRHLIFPKTPIKEMPTQLGRLNCLQTLTRFIVSRNSGSCIGELGKLANLGGKLSISELQNVVSPTDALDARLKEKKYLEELELEWKADTNISESQKAALTTSGPVQT